MSAIVANTGSNNWNTNGAWVGGVQPGAGDDVTIPATANVSITGAITVNCRSCTIAASGTLTFGNAATNILQIGDGTAGAGNVALSVSSSATISLAATPGTIQFISTSATQQTITTGGQTLPVIVFNGVGGSWINSDNITASGITLTNGSWATGNFSVTLSSVAFTGTTTRTFAPGSSAFSLSSTGAPINAASATGLTVSANTATFTFTGTDSNPAGAGVNWNGASLIASGAGACTFSSPGTWANFTRTGTAITTCTLLFTTAGPTVTSAFTVNSNSLTNRVLVASSVVGTPITITAGSFVFTNVVDFMDITGAGAATWTVAGGGGTALGDCGGNSGITFTTPAATTYTGAGTAFTWSLTTGASWSAGRIPLPQDDVTINSGSGSVTPDLPRLCRSIDMTGSTRLWARPSAGFSLNIFGNITMTSIVATTNWTVVLAGRSSYTITTNGQTINSAVTIQAPSGTYTNQDAMTAVGNIIHTSGTYNTNGFTMTCAAFNTSGTITRTTTITNSTINLTGGAVVWTAVATGLTLNATPSNIVVQIASASARTFAGGGLTYDTLTYTVSGSVGALAITGSNTFNVINFSDASNARTLTLPAAGTQTINNAFNVFGTSGNLVTLNSATGGTTSTLSRTSGIVNSAYLSIQDITATGGNGITGTLQQEKWSPGPGSVALTNVKGFGFNSIVTTTILRPHAFSPGLAR